MDAVQAEESGFGPRSTPAAKADAGGFVWVVAESNTCVCVGGCEIPNAEVDAADESDFGPKLHPGSRSRRRREITFIHFICFYFFGL